jgi:hypothetical protein
VTVIVAGTTLVASAGAAFAVTSWPAPAPAAGHRPPVAQGLSHVPSASTSHPGVTASRTSTPAAASKPASAASSKPASAHHPASTPRPAASPAALGPPPVYRNPLRDITGLIPERVDMGVDFGGNGPIYALGDAVITNATGDSAGWPGGGWITYQLTSGPAKGLQVYVAEDVQPTVQVGQHVTSSTVIAQMHNVGDGIETGWAMPDASSAESQLPAAGSVSGGGPFPTEVGLDFDRLLVALGVPAAFNLDATGYGTLPAGYPTTWTSLRS